jgi:DNA repair protein RadC
MLSPDERPREKLLAKGPKVLSDAELLALLIGTGTRNESAVEMARRILHSVNHDLQSLGSMKWKELSNFKGMGEAKAVTIVAALELAKRKMSAGSKQSIAIRH